MSGVARLAEVLKPYAHMLGSMPFIGRAPVLPDTGEHDDSRWYPDPFGTGRRFQSVTWTISSTESSPWLQAWAAKLAAELVVDNWSELGGMMRDVGPAPVMQWLKDEAKVQRELAADVGTWHHDVMEAILLDRSIPDPPEHIIGRRLTTGGENILITPEALDRWADGILNFLTDYRVTVVMTEATLYNERERYAMRVDVVGELPGYGVIAIDMKTGALRSSVIAQQTAARNATHIMLPSGELIPMIKVDGAGALHLRQVWQRGYKLRPVPTGPDQWAWFKACNQLLINRADQPDIERLVMYPPKFGTSGEVIAIPTVPMIEDSGLRCRRLLGEAGFTWLHELAEFTASDLMSDPKRKTGIRGVGAGAIKDIRAALAKHGLALAGESMRGAA